MIEDQTLSIVMELMEVSLFELIRREKLELSEQVRIAKEIASGMKFLVAQNPPIFHRDLKSANVLLDKSRAVRITDFGLATVAMHTMTKNKGTFQYCAPETFDMDVKITNYEKCDVYSFGVVLWELLSREVPWKGLSEQQILTALLIKKTTLPISSTFPPLLSEIMTSCWNQFELRPTFAEIVNQLNSAPVTPSEPENHNKALQPSIVLNSISAPLSVEALNMQSQFNSITSHATVQQSIDDAPKELIKYRVTVRTGNVGGAGTDANVFIHLFGDAGETSDIVLKNSDKKYPFEKGQVANFVVEAVDVGTIQKLRIGHDNYGIGPGWFLNCVTVAVDNKGSWDFPCNRWFDKNEDDKQIVRDLVPGQLPSSATKPTEAQSYSFTPVIQGPIFRAVYAQAQPKGMIKYKVAIRTGDVPGAGTNASVFIHLFGDAGETSDIILKNSDKKYPFEKGQVDNFVVDAIDVGTIQKLRIGHDNYGIGAGWFLNSATVAVDNKGSWYFPCNRWFDKNEDDKQIVRDLLPAPSTSQTTSQSTTSTTSDRYKVLDPWKKEIKVGSKVLYSAYNGIVRFVGETKFASGIWIGIEFTQPVGRNDGTLQGVTYFGPLQPNHGIFAKPDKVQVLE